MLDTEGWVYSDYGLGRGSLRQVFGPVSIAPFLRANLHAETRQRGLKGGSMMQMPGTFVVDSQGVVRFAQSRFRCHHSGMLLLVTKSKRGDIGLDLGDVATRFAHQLCAGNTRDCDQHIDVVACLLDLLKLTFQTEPVCFGRGQFAAELL